MESVTNPRALRQFHKLFKAGYATMSRNSAPAWINDVLTFLDDMESKDEKTAPPPKKAVPAAVKKKTADKSRRSPAPADNRRWMPRNGR